eukprot:gene13239-19075_t
MHGNGESQEVLPYNIEMLCSGFRNQGRSSLVKVSPRLFKPVSWQCATIISGRKDLFALIVVPDFQKPKFSFRGHWSQIVASYMRNGSVALYRAPANDSGAAPRLEAAKCMRRDSHVACGQGERERT